MATMRTTLRDWLGLSGKSARVADTRQVLLVRWLRRVAFLGFFFALVGAVMQAFGHAWGADATGMGLTLLALGLVMSSMADATDRKQQRRRQDDSAAQ